MPRSTKKPPRIPIASTASRIPPPQKRLETLFHLRPLFNERDAILDALDHNLCAGTHRLIVDASRRHRLAAFRLKSDLTDATLSDVRHHLAQAPLQDIS